MQKIQIGQDIASFLGLMPAVSQKKPKKLKRINKVAIIVVAFFIIIIISLLFNVLSQHLDARTKSIKKVETEPVAFLPSRVVTEKIMAGYFK